MFLVGSPEQVMFMMEEEEPDEKHSFRADPDSTQSGLISHAALLEDSFLCPVEAADPQSNSLHMTSADVRVQLEPNTGLHSPRFTSRAPAQRLDPPTNLTRSEQNQESHQ